MSLKRFVLFWLVFTMLIVVYVYTFQPGSYTYEAPFGLGAITLPISVWITLPFSIFFLFILLFVLVGKILNFFRKRIYRRDYHLLLRQIENQALEKPFETLYTIPEFRTLSKVLARFSLLPNTTSTPSGEKAIDQILTAYTQVSQGEVINTRALRLLPNSTLYIRHELNRLDQDSSAASQILKDKDAALILKKAAFLSLIRHGQGKEISKRLKDKEFPLDQELVFALLSAYKNGKVPLEIEEIAKMTLEASFTSKDYLKLAFELKGGIEPDAWMTLFKALADQGEAAEEACLYTLLELEMLSEAKERLATQPAEDFQRVRAYLELRKAKLNYPVDLFFF